MTESRLEELAIQEPKVLKDLIQDGLLPPSSLTFALEYLGVHNPEMWVAEFIFGYLTHESPIVREGALYGLEAVLAQLGLFNAFVHCDDVNRYINKIIWMSINDPSEAIRTVAKNTLEEYNTPECLP